ATSQGRMDALINSQPMCADLTGTDIATPSLLDEAPAAAEAMTLAKRAGRSKSNVYYVSERVHPQTLEVLRTRAAGLDIELEVGPEEKAAEVDCFAVLLQYPDTFGTVRDYRELTKKIHERGGLVTVSVDLLALAL